MSISNQEQPQQEQCFCIVNVAFCPAGIGVKTSPTATTGGTRTVWSSGTMRQGTGTGMMRAAVWSKTGSVRCSFSDNQQLGNDRKTTTQPLPWPGWMRTYTYNPCVLNKQEDPGPACTKAPSDVGKWMPVIMHNSINSQPICKKKQQLKNVLWQLFSCLSSWTDFVLWFIRLWVKYMKQVI